MVNNMKSVALHNLGCKVNGYETDVMQQMLQEKGYKIVPFDEQADIYIINTCTVTNIADRKSRQMLHRAKKKNPEAVVVAVGCYVQTGKEEALLDDSIDLAIGNNRKKDLIPILEEFLTGKDEDKTLHGRTVIDVNHTDEYESMMLVHTAEHTRAFLKIQDGCNQFCSYCIIPFARGRVRSRSMEEILEEAGGLVQAGYKEIVLTGIHISSYGMEWDGEQGRLDGRHLLTLIERLQELVGLERIRLGSLEPRIISEEFVGGIAATQKVCPHFHLSLQSGSDAVLKRMNRHYTTAEYEAGVGLLRSAYGNPAITTDVIAGFPGETEEEFEETRQFLKRVGFYEMHIFKYSRRQGTRAAAMTDQIPERVKAVRSNVLLQEEAQMSHAFREKLLQTRTAVLMEETRTVEDKIYQIGHTKEYVKVAKQTPESLSGQIIEGMITGFLTPDILLLQ